MDEPQVRHRSRRALDLGPATRVRPEGDIRTPKEAEDLNLHVVALKQFVEQKQIEDPFAVKVVGADGMQVVDPPYNFASLLRLPIENNMLRQCIDAMVTNVEGHGYRLEYIGDVEGGEDSAEAKNEKAVLEGLLDFPNDEYTLQELRERCRRDLESVGNAFIEVGRDIKGRVVMLAHIPAHTVRLTTRDRDATQVTMHLPRADGAADIPIKRRFRRYVQLQGADRVYFKEFGDTRVIDPRTGHADPSMSLEDSATEIIHLSLYTPGSAYGLPRWFPQLPAVMGSRQAELTNLDFFRENAIPALAVMVAGGLLSNATMNAIESHLISVRGRASMNRVVFIEALGDAAAADEHGRIPPPKIDLKNLNEGRPQDGLFLEYDAQCQRKVRSSFRIPPIFVGLADDYSHATALASYDVAESQVFGPERNRADDLFNNKILATYNPQYWAFRTNPPRLTNPEALIEAIGTFDTVGAMTPNLAIGLANELFDLDIPLREEPWADLPFPMISKMPPREVLGFETAFGEAPPPPVVVAPDAGNESPDKVGDEATGDEDNVGEEADDAQKLYAALTSSVGTMRALLTKRSPAVAPLRHRRRADLPA